MDNNVDIVRCKVVGRVNDKSSGHIFGLLPHWVGPFIDYSVKSFDFHRRPFLISAERRRVCRVRVEQRNGWRLAAVNVLRQPSLSGASSSRSPLQVGHYSTLQWLLRTGNLGHTSLLLFMI